jgi:two-component system chemotaxis response regulator CheB
VQAAGSRTLAQDEATRVVWGMPGEAVSIGTVDDVLPIDEMAQHIHPLAEGMDFTEQAAERWESG